MRSTTCCLLVASVLINGGDLPAKPALETKSLSTGSDVAVWTVPSDNPKYKTPILYLHGGPGMYTEDRRIVEGQIFRDLGFATIYFDQAGGGQSKKIPASEYTIDRAVIDLEALRIILEKEKLILWGNSYGATLAAIYASRYPNRVAALIFTSPGVFPGTKPNRNYKLTARGKPRPSKSVKEAIRIIDKSGPDGEKAMTQDEAGLIFDELLNSTLMGGLICKGSFFEIERLPGGANFYANRLIQKSIKGVKFERKSLPELPTVTLRGTCDYHPKENAQLYREFFGGSLIEIDASGHGLLENRHLVERALREFGENELGVVE